MAVKSIQNGNELNAKYELNKIHLADSGEYELSFYVYMFCGQVDCADRDDQILLNLKFDNNQSSLFKIDYTNIEEQKIWVKQIIKFSVETNSYLNVNFF